MEKALFRNNLIKKITAALMIVMLLIPYCFAQVTFGDNKSDLKNAQNQQNDIQNKKKETLTHPYLKEKIEWGMVPYVQAMLLARYLRGDLDGYPVFLWK